MHKDKPAAVDLLSVSNYTDTHLYLFVLWKDLKQLEHNTHTPRSGQDRTWTPNLFHIALITFKVQSFVGLDAQFCFLFLL